MQVTPFMIRIGILLLLFIFHIYLFFISHINRHTHRHTHSDNHSVVSEWYSFCVFSLSPSVSVFSSSPTSCVCLFTHLLFLLLQPILHFSMTLQTTHIQSSRGRSKTVCIELELDMGSEPWYWVRFLSGEIWAGKPWPTISLYCSWATSSLMGAG